VQTVQNAIIAQLFHFIPVHASFRNESSSKRNKPCMAFGAPFENNCLVL
jgi:hypothetical protein